MSSGRRLAWCGLASLALHWAALAAAAFAGAPVLADYLRDAAQPPVLHASLVAAPPPSRALDGLLSPLEETLIAWSKPPARARSQPGSQLPRPPEKAETIYYSARQVDVRAVPLGEIVPINPDLTGRESGVVILRLLINPAGVVDNVMVHRAEPQRGFGEALLLPFRTARFSPARKSGRAVGSEMLVELRYGPDEEQRDEKR